VNPLVVGIRSLAGCLWGAIHLPIRFRNLRQLSLSNLQQLLSGLKWSDSVEDKKYSIVVRLLLFLRSRTLAFIGAPNSNVCTPRSMRVWSCRHSALSLSCPRQTEPNGTGTFSAI